MPTVLDMSQVPRGSGLLCVRCGYCYPEHVTRDYVYESGHYWGARCGTCGIRTEHGSVVVPLLDRESVMLDVESARRFTYYHFTERKDWPTYRTYPGAGEHENFWAHVGTSQSALDRALTLGARVGFVYVVRVKAEALWSPDVLADDGRMHGVDCAPGEYQVRRYLNRYEAPGTISLAVCNTMLEVIDKFEYRK